MNTNHQCVRGNYTAKADSMGAGQIGGSQKSLLWDKMDTMLSADRRKTRETEVRNLGRTFVDRESSSETKSATRV